MIKLNELYKCNYDVNIEGISVNSKDTKKGDLFVCIMGRKVDRHNYIDEAINNGAAALVTNRDVNVSVPYIKVENPNNEVIYLSKKIYNNPQEKLKMYGVTGTDGKTSVATIVSNLLGTDNCGYIGTNGRSCAKFQKDTDNTTPSPDKLYSYLDEFLSSGCNSVCMELSSEAKLLGRLNELYFDCIGMTNITSEHLNSHGTLENYVNCKKDIMTLTKKNGYCVLNRDDKYFNEVYEICNDNVLTYGKDFDNDLQIVDYKIFTSHTLITFKYKNEIYEIDSPLLGEFNVYNLACAMLMCLAMGNDINKLIANIKNIKIAGRLDIIDRGQNFTVMVDYAHTPNGIMQLLKFVKGLDVNKIIVVIGQAGERDAVKRSEVGKIVATIADLAIFCYEDPRGEDPNDIIDMMCLEIKNLNNYIKIVDRSEAIKYAISVAEENDIVLILGKGNETYEKLKDRVIYFNDEEEAIKHLDNRLKLEKNNGIYV